MPLGEFIKEIVVHTIFELVFYTIFYWSGRVFFEAPFLRKIEVAPLKRFGDRNPGEKWYKSSIWLKQSGGKKILKAEMVVFVGLLAWVLVGLGIWFYLSSNPSSASARLS